MKICYLNHDLSDKTGAGRFYHSLISALEKIVPDFQYEVLTHDSGLPKKCWQLPFFYFCIRRAFKYCDIIHALDGWPYGVIAAIVSLGSRKKLIITGIGTGAVKPFYSWWRRPIMKWAYKRAFRVIAVSNNTKREIQKFLPDLEISVINHGVDFTKFESISGTSDVQTIDVNIGTSEVQKLKPYILSVGTLKQRKGYEYSIAAFAEVAKKFPGLKYVIVGKGPEYEALQRQVSSIKYQDRVVFLENLSEEELISVYKNAELFILMPQDVNKDIEGFGLVFLEAAAAGLPVITTKETSAEDAVRDGKNGILVSPQNPKSASAAMEKILSNPDLRFDMSKNSISFARSMSWGKTAQLYNVIYNKMLSLNS